MALIFNCPPHPPAGFSIAHTSAAILLLLWLLLLWNICFIWSSFPVFCSLLVVYLIAAFRYSMLTNFNSFFLLFLSLLCRFHGLPDVRILKFFAAFYNEAISPLLRVIYSVADAFWTPGSISQVPYPYFLELSVSFFDKMFYISLSVFCQER
jgi:hypothetical protein